MRRADSRYSQRFARKHYVVIRKCLSGMQRAWHALKAVFQVWCLECSRCSDSQPSAQCGTPTIVPLDRYSSKLLYVLLCGENVAPPRKKLRSHLLERHGSQCTTKTMGSSLQLRPLRFKDVGVPIIVYFFLSRTRADKHVQWTRQHLAY
jgi:hypothetical protein